MQYFAIFVLILVIKFPCINTYIGTADDNRICFSHMNSIGGFPEEGSYFMVKRILDHNCTHIIGNVILTGLYRNDDGTDPDLSFLKSIKEITGYLLIMYSNVHSIPLTNLRVIRADNGGYKLHDDLELGGLVVRKNFKHGYTLQHIDLRNLKSIVQGSVYIYDNPGLNYIPYTVRWSEIFESVGEQNFYTNEVIIIENNRSINLNSIEHNPMNPDKITPKIDLPYPKCSLQCPVINNQSYCWGPTDDECQHQTKCQNLLCNRCSTHGNVTSCCHEQCLGGCSGPLASQCESCKEYSNSGVCVSHCPSKTINRFGKLIPNTEFKYRLGNLCVTNCPDGFMIEDDVCVTHCSAGSTSLDGRFCFPCKDDCPKSCKLPKVGERIQIMDLRLLKSLINCTILEGDLVITKESFGESVKNVGHQPITNSYQLWFMHSLREITGYVYLDLQPLGDSLKNLSFLENLVKVGGYLSSARISIMIMNSEAIYPGLRSLRSVPHGSVIFHGNSKMCYLSTLPWFTSKNDPVLDKISDDIRISVHEGADPKQCEKENYICDSTCDPMYGCWGPGPDQCVRCLYRRAGPYTCVHSCTDLPGFMSEHWETKSNEGHLSLDQNVKSSSIVKYTGPDADNICIPCHPECGKSCTGPGPHECIGACKTAWSSGQCVSQCHPTTYLNVDRRICEPCQTHCHQRQLTNQPVCTGPGRYPGKGGCNKCEKFVILTSPEQENYSNQISNGGTISMMCIRGDCPPETYLTTEIVQPNLMFARFTEMFTSVIPLCRPCHPLCPVCTAYGLVKANNQRLGCVVCNGFWFRDTCVEQCPTEQTYAILLEPNDTASGKYLSEEYSNLREKNTNYSNLIYVRHLDGECLACHEQCHAGCWGPKPDQCNHCLHVKVPIRFLSENMTKYYRGDDQINEFDKRNMQNKSLPYAISGKFICLSSCPPELNNLISDQILGDNLCISKTELNEYDRNLLIQDHLLPIDLTHSFINRPTIHKYLMTHKSFIQSTKFNFNDSMIILIIFPIFILLICIIFIIYYRYRKYEKYWINYTEQNYHREQFSLIKLLFCPQSIISKKLMLSYKSCKKLQSSNMIFIRNNYDLTCNHDYPNQDNQTHDHDKFENKCLNSNSECTSLLLRSNKNGIYRNHNHLSTSHKAPNLGRLVMINLDDLWLQEHSGPLGTGAFGAVYRGLWRVRTSDLSHLPHLQNVLEAKDEILNSPIINNTIKTNPIIENEPLINTDNNLDKQIHTDIDDKISVENYSKLFCPNDSETVESNFSNTNSETNPHHQSLQLQQQYETFNHKQTNEHHTVSIVSESRDYNKTNDKPKHDYKYYCVAVKILNEIRGSSDLQALLDEAKVMASVSHHHCLPLLGICLSQSRKCLVSAYVINGSLDRYLRSHAPDLDSTLLLDWAAQIADGMAYLQSRGIIHRDLATRNVLVTSTDHLQITDFGLAKMLETDEGDKRNEVIVCSGRVPIRWLACETLTHRIYSFKTDVWAYGVTIWEIFTFGSKPYENIETGNVKDHVLTGARLPQPDICRLNLYQVMLNCWNENPNARPNFVELYNMFKEFTNQSHLYVHSHADSSLNTTDVYSTTEDTRSRTTIYPNAQLSNERLHQSTHHDVSVLSLKHPSSNSSSHNLGSGSTFTTNSNTSRRFDLHKRPKITGLMPPSAILQAHRLAKYQHKQQNRRSIDARTDNTMSTSVSMNSGMSERWSHSSFPTHSHPALTEVTEANGSRNVENNFEITKSDNSTNLSERRFDSWASSGHPLLSSDQDSSLSQLMLSNFGYTSSGSRNSMIVGLTSQNLRNQVASSHSLPTNDTANLDHNISNLAPINQSQHLNETTINPSINISYEVAAGYVWPQWPAGIPNPEQNVDNFTGDIVQSPTQSAVSANGVDIDDNFPSLNRQLWLRRNDRQRRYYLTQSQLRRTATESIYPEQPGESSSENNSNRTATIGSSAQNDLNAIPEDSDTDHDSVDRYWPDPTNATKS